MSGATASGWFHTIGLPDGSVTPGVFDARPVADLVPWPRTLQGARCLDIGTCDGFWAFEMERRGAREVVAIDLDTRDRRDESWHAQQSRPSAAPTATSTAGQRFEIARAALRSRAERQVVSVYDLDPAIHGRFDVVFMGSVLIHLRHPAEALDRIARICAGDLVLVETVDAFLDRFSPKAAARLEPAGAQWWRLNRTGLKTMLNLSGFDVVAQSAPFVTPFGPGQIAAAARRSTLHALFYKHMVARPQSLASVTAFSLTRGTYDVALRARIRSAT